MRDCRNTLGPNGGTVPVLSSTVMVQVALNTQLTCGALTLTTVRLADCAGAADSAAAAAKSNAGAVFMAPPFAGLPGPPAILPPVTVQGKVAARCAAPAPVARPGMTIVSY